MKDIETVWLFGCWDKRVTNCFAVEGFNLCSWWGFMNSGKSDDLCFWGPIEIDPVTNRPLKMSQPQLAGSQDTQQPEIFQTFTQNCHKFTGPGPWTTCVKLTSAYEHDELWLHEFTDRLETVEWHGSSNSCACASSSFEEGKASNCGDRSSDGAGSHRAHSDGASKRGHAKEIERG